MSIQQISIFVQSKPGHLHKNLELLRSEGISVRGFSCSDTGDYGIARFVVDDPARALAVFSDRGAAVTATEVVCLALKDEPGELARVFGLLADAGINILYSYSLISTYIAFKVDDPAQAEQVLRDAGVATLSLEDLV